MGPSLFSMEASSAHIADVVTAPDLLCDPGWPHQPTCHSVGIPARCPWVEPVLSTQWWGAENEQGVQIVSSTQWCSEQPAHMYTVVLHSGARRACGRVLAPLSFVERDSSCYLAEV
jgi:hypothetical protein